MEGSNSYGNDENRYSMDECARMSIPSEMSRMNSSEFELSWLVFPAKDSTCRMSPIESNQICEGVNNRSARSRNDWRTILGSKCMASVALLSVWYGRMIGSEPKGVRLLSLAHSLE